MSEIFAAIDARSSARGVRSAGRRGGRALTDPVIEPAMEEMVEDEPQRIARRWLVLGIAFGIYVTFRMIQMTVWLVEWIVHITR